MAAAVQFDNVTLGYGNHPAVHHLTGAFEQGTLTAVVGVNGSGKSTLLKGVAGLLKPMAGTITVAQGANVAYLAQTSSIDRDFPAEVIDLVTMGLWPQRGLLGRYTAADKANVAAAIKAVGLTGFEHRPLDTLSGGQFQRALFARVALQDAQVILLDEPFAGVDAGTVMRLMGMIREWSSQGRTVLAVLHDVEFVRTHFPHVLLMARTPIALGPPAMALTPANLRRAAEFDEAWHDEAPWCDGDEAALPTGSEQAGKQGQHHGHTHHHNEAAE